MAKATKVSEVKHLSKYPKMIQRYFVPIIKADDTEDLIEVFKVNSKAQPDSQAQTYDVITSTGKTHVFATKVNEVIKVSQAEKNRELAKLKSDFMSGKIDHKAYADRVTQLI